MNNFFDFLGRSLRGVRLLEFGALLVLLVMVLGVYLAKASAGRERGDITAVQAQIDEEQHRMRLLQAEVAHLEQPERIERLSLALGLGPTAAKHESALDALPEIARTALPSEKSEHHAPSSSTQTGFEGPAAPVVMASAAAHAGAPQ
jgi:cell division protein FtsL